MHHFGHNIQRYGIVSAYKNKKEPSQVLAGNNTHSPTPKAQLANGSSNFNLTKNDNFVNEKLDDPNEDYAKQFFEDEQDILYTRNNKDINEFLSNRRHVPEAITDDVFIYRILQKEDDVNREMQKSQDGVDNFLTREHKEFFKDSKVRDEKGNLLKMYHGVERCTIFGIPFNKKSLIINQ